MYKDCGAASPTREIDLKVLRVCALRCGGEAAIQLTKFLKFKIQDTIILRATVLYCRCPYILVLLFCSTISVPTHGTSAYSLRPPVTRVAEPLATEAIPATAVKARGGGQDNQLATKALWAALGYNVVVAVTVRFWIFARLSLTLTSAESVAVCWALFCSV